MDKSVLQEYIDACELIKETEQDIRKLNQKKKTVIQTSVKGSMQEFPYTETRFHVAGTPYTYADYDRLQYEENLLEQRKANAEEIKHQVEKWMLTIPVRMQRIVKYRCFEGLSWDKVAAKMGKKATADSVRKEFERFF